MNGPSSQSISHTVDYAGSHTNQTGVYILIWRQVKFHYKRDGDGGCASLDYTESVFFSILIMRQRKIRKTKGDGKNKTKAVVDRQITESLCEKKTKEA